jgi:hypothetical protein
MQLLPLSAQQHAISAVLQERVLEDVFVAQVEKWQPRDPQADYRAGYRGDRIFYRRAMLACRGTKWRHIEFEYPAAQKRYFDNFVTREQSASGAPLVVMAETRIT